MGRTERIPGIRATREEKEKLEKILNALGMSRTEWMCAVIESHAKILERARLEKVAQPTMVLNGNPTFRIRTALALAFRSAGEQDPAWLVDQLVRVLLDEGEYQNWRKEYESLRGRQWDCGIPPTSD